MGVLVNRGGHTPLKRVPSGPLLQPETWLVRPLRIQTSQSRRLIVTFRTERADIHRLRSDMNARMSTARLSVKKHARESNPNLTRTYR